MKRSFRIRRSDLYSALAENSLMSRPDILASEILSFPERSFTYGNSSPHFPKFVDASSSTVPEPAILSPDFSASAPSTLSLMFVREKRSDDIDSLASSVDISNSSPTFISIWRIIPSSRAMFFRSMILARFILPGCFFFLISRFGKDADKPEMSNSSKSISPLSSPNGFRPTFRF
ncbi:MAG: hypothetical protein BWY40_01201 [bacterium ADurb.Bin270]|nr:MAG: hypothetical protein BWY40_01201 [bacterium ADurb.Bin270]